MATDTSRAEPEANRCQHESHETKQINGPTGPDECADEYPREHAERGLDDRSAKRGAAQENPANYGNEERTNHRAESRSKTEGTGYAADVGISNLAAQIQEHRNAPEHPAANKTKSTQTDGDSDDSSD